RDLAGPSDYLGPVADDGYLLGVPLDPVPGLLPRRRRLAGQRDVYRRLEAVLAPSGRVLRSPVATCDECPDCGFAVVLDARTQPPPASGFQALLQVRRAGPRRQLLALKPEAGQA